MLAATGTVGIRVATLPQNACTTYVHRKTKRPRERERERKGGETERKRERETETERKIHKKREKRKRAMAVGKLRMWELKVDARLTHRELS